jgi:hypothetical protein
MPNVLNVEQEWSEQAVAPSTPAAGRRKIYPGTDDKWHDLDEAGAIDDLLMASDIGVTVEPYDADLISLAAAQGDTIYGSAANIWSKLAKDANVTRYLSNRGASNNPLWSLIDLVNGVENNLQSPNGATLQTISTTGSFKLDPGLAALSFIRLTGAAPDVLGMDAPTGGAQIVIIYYAGSGVLTLQQASGGVAASERLYNRISSVETPIGVSLSQLGGMAIYIYDSAAANWKMVYYEQGAANGGAGWNVLDKAIVYASADDPTFTCTCVGVDLTGVLSVGMRLRVSQSTGGTKYFIITAIAFSTDTTLTLYGGTDYNLENEAINNPYYSVAKAPLGFPLSPDVWSFTLTDTTAREQSSPTANVWYNNGSLSINIPIGAWEVSVSVNIMGIINGVNPDVRSTLSAANNSETDPGFTAVCISIGATAVDHRAWLNVFVSKPLILTSKTTYYLNIKTGSTSMIKIGFRNDIAPLYIRARCAYL